MKKILVIKHGSLGDLILSLSSMYSIRNKYNESSIHLITEEKYYSFVKKTNFFEKIIKDNRKSFFLMTIFILLKLLREKYDIVIDLQNSQRSTFYNFVFRFFGKSLVCSSRPFAQLRYKIPLQGKENAEKGLANQLNLLKINSLKIDNYNWLKVEIDKEFDSPFVLFIPGVSKGNDYKQWQPENFSKLIDFFESKNYKVCVVGTKNDLPAISLIINKNKNIINKIDSSPPEIIYSISLKAKLIISNDTGPGHIASLSKNNIIWILNEDKISKANIKSSGNNHKISANNIKDISPNEVCEYININNLLNT